MKKRRLLVDDTPREQFATLRQIPSLTQNQCREVVALLHPEDEGRRTCSRIEDAHVEALPCLRSLQVEREELAPLTIHCMSLQGLLAAKIRTCPLFAKCVTQMFQQHGPRSPLIMYVDDTQGGNTLAPLQTRKSTLVYCAFLHQPLLHLESLWLTLSVVKATDAATCPGGLCSVVSSLMTFYEEETRHGLVVDVAGESQLMFVPHVLFLSDHEGVRASLGCKGASGVRPCIKCKNVLGQGRAASVPGHEDVTCSDIRRFVRSTQEHVEETLRVLQAQETRKNREEAEKFLGFNLESLQVSPLTQPHLKDFFSLDMVQYDALHHYFSNGLVAQELGLWFSAIQACGVTVDHMKQYAEVAWTPVKNGCITAPQPANHFNDKLWRKGVDFRGDASTCLSVLPLAVSYGEDMLRGAFPDLSPVLDSLQNLHEVVICIKTCKIDVSQSDSLVSLQKQHMDSFAVAYTADLVRPKMHYAFHLKEQMNTWGKAIDAFVCERKHRCYKTLCAKNLGQPGQKSFARSALLHVVSFELANPLPETKLITHLVGKPKQCASLQKMFSGCEPVLITSALEHVSVRYGRGQYIQMSLKLAVQVVCAIQHGSQFFLLVNTLEAKGINHSSGRTQWVCPMGGHSSRALLRVDDKFNALAGPPCMYVGSHSANSLWLLR